MTRLALILLLSAVSAQAQQTVAIQTGEHDGFSRLVLSIDPDSDWSLETGNGTVTLNFPRQQLSFNTGQIFDRMPRTRVQEVEPVIFDDGSSLTLSLACDCPVNSFAFKGAYIVVDISDGPPLNRVPAQQAEAQAVSQYWRPGALTLAGGQVDPVNLDSSISPRQPAQLFEYAPAVPDEQQVTPPLDQEEEEVVDVASLPLSGPELAEIVLNPLTSEDPDMRRRIEQAQSQLLEQLARAADQGLLEFVPPEIEVPELPPPQIEAEVAEPEAPAIDAELLQQLSARTAYDQDIEGLLSQVVNEFAKPQCIDNTDFSMAGWSDGRPFSDQVGTLRVSLIGEFDRPDDAALVALIHLYLRLGFGAEAAILLDQEDWQVQNGAILVDFARILNDRAPTASGPVSKGRGCGGAHEMWYLLNAPSGPEILEVGSVIEAFASYPIEIRTLTGPDLAAAFTTRHQTEAAHVVLEIVRRADGDITPAQRLAEAHLLESGGDTDAALQIYQELAVGTNAVVPHALISLAWLTLTLDDPFPDSLLVDLGSAAHLEKSTDLGRELRYWEIRVEAKLSGMSVALSSVSQELETGIMDRQTLRNLVGEVLLGASPDRAGVLDYVRLVLAYQDLLQDGEVADAARLVSAQNLVEIGLPEPALAILSPTMLRHNAEINRIAAKAMLQLFSPDEALRLVADDDSAQAIEIRLEAELLRVNYPAVVEILPVAAQQNLDVNDAAWRAGEWREVQGNQTAEVLAAYLEGPKPSDHFQPAVGTGEVAFLTDVAAPVHPNLQKAHELLEVNRASRSYLEELLATDLGG